MKLYHMPGACSLADLIVLQWIGAPHELVYMSLETMKSPDYLAINAGGSVPLLMHGDMSLTENVAITTSDPMGTTESEQLPASDEFPSITFYPDGTSDSAEVVLASRNDDDERRLAVRLGGMLGTGSTRTMSASEVENGGPDAEAAAVEEYNDLFESSVPVSHAESSSDFNTCQPAAE